jgi:hypothetical protein
MTSTAGERSTIVNRTVLHRRPNAELRPREYLIEREVAQLIDAARKHGRHGHRDATAILVAYRHGLRATELCELTWYMIELDVGRIHIRRSKNGVDSIHPLTGKEIRALRQLRRENLQSRYVFNTERGGPVTRAWFLKLLNRLSAVGQAAVPGAPAHAAPCLRVQAGERRRRYARPAALPRSQEHPAHGALHRAALRPVQWVLEGLEDLTVVIAAFVAWIGDFPPMQQARPPAARGG